MKSFLSIFSGLVLGILNGFDRRVFRGNLKQLCYREGMEIFLCANHVLYKDFKKHSTAQTERLIQASFEEAKRLERPIVYLTSAKESKEDRARAFAAQEGIEDALICCFKSLET